MVGLTHGMQYCNHECWCDRAPAGKVPNASLTSECPNPPLVFCCVTVTFQICTVTGITTTRCHSTNKQSNMGETQNILARKRNCSFWTLKQNNVESNLSASWIKKKTSLKRYQKVWRMWEFFFSDRRKSWWQARCCGFHLFCIILKSDWAITHVPGDLWFLLSVL